MGLRITHVITGTDVGGAEAMLLSLLRAEPDRSSCEVVSLRPPGSLAPTIAALGVRVRSLGLLSAWGLPRAVWTLARWLRETRPDVVQAWMYHANLVGGLAGRLAGVPVAWGLHATALDPAREKPGTIRLARWLARLSGRVPARIVACAESSRRFHESLGYRSDRMVVIPNAFDTEALAPSDAARREARAELGLGAADLVVMGAARYSPMKDHANLVAAAGRLAARLPAARFVLCGSGVDWSTAELAAAIDAAGVRDRFRLLGLRHDLPRLLAAADVFTTSSAYGEAMPVVVGEAMACGVPCVVTDVGDSAVLVGGTGLVVPPRDPAALARAWEELLARPAEERTALGLAARERIRTRYSLDACARAYAAVHAELARAQGAGRGRP